MEVSITYRQLLKNDKLQYRKLRLESLNHSPENFEATYEEEYGKAELSFEKSLNEVHKNFIGFGAFDGDHLVGIALFKRSEYAKTSHKGEILQIYIREEFRNKKFGLALLKSLIDFAWKTYPSLESIRASLIQRNLPARCLLYKLGFTIYGIENSYFKTQDGYDHVVLMNLEKVNYLKK